MTEVHQREPNFESAAVKRSTPVFKREIALEAV